MYMSSRFQENTGQLKTPAQQVDSARRCLSELRQVVSRIMERHSGIFQKGELCQCVEQLQGAFQDATRRLEKPAFRISSIGTTSSGKSTLVNALLGRRLAPIESDEMSAGILTFVHSEISRFVVEPTPGAVWETGEWTGLSDEEMYLRLRATEQEHGRNGIMVAYHREKKKRQQLEAPRVRIETPLLPVCSPELLNLPDNIRLEIVDLPGLNGIRDRRNLKIVQEYVRNSFSLVVLDYTRSDDSNRDALIRELRDVVEIMQGRTDAMLFALNKVNLRSREDQPLEQRETSLKQGIAEKLELDTPPDLISINAQLLYYIQCAWGPAPVPLTPDNANRLKLLENCLEDCAGVFRQKRKDDEDVRAWLDKYEFAPGKMDEDAFRKLLEWSYAWSGGDCLWERLRERIRERFPELVIFPAIQQLLANRFNEFILKTEEVIRIRKFKTLEVAGTERKRLQQEFADIRAEITRHKTGFLNRITIALENLRKDDSNARQQAVRYLGNLPEFQALPRAVEKVRVDLFINIIRPVQRALKAGTAYEDLRGELTEFLPDVHARRTAAACNIYISKFLEPAGQPDRDLIIEVREGDAASEKRMAEAVQTCQHLYKRMRESMSDRAELMLQMQSRTIEQAVESLLSNETRKLEELIQPHFRRLNLENIFPRPESAIDAMPINLPERLFVLPEPHKQLEKRQGMMGAEIHTSYRSGTCFQISSRKNALPASGNQYNILTLPSPDKMALQWDSGIGMAEKSLWRILTEWIESLFNEVMTCYLAAISRMESLFEESFTTRIQELEAQEKANIEKLDSVTVNLQAAKDIYEKLRQMAVTQVPSPVSGKVLLSEKK